MNNIKLSAWSLKKDISRQIYPLYPPPEYIEVARKLTEERRRITNRWSGIPIRSLNTLMIASFNPTFHAVPRSWNQSEKPWIFATEIPQDMSRMPILVRGWLREEFTSKLGEDIVESHLDKIRNIKWQWQSKPIQLSLLNSTDEEHKNILYQAIPNYLAQEFLKHPKVTLTNSQTIKFYPVVQLRGAELMSWPPIETQDSNSKSKMWISLVIHFYLQTLPWRKSPLIYNQVSVRRWLTRPLWENEKNYVPGEGVSVYLLNQFRWLDEKLQNPTFVKLKISRGNNYPQFPGAISELIKGRKYLPTARDVAAFSIHENDWGRNQNQELQTAIAYDTSLGKHPCLPGVSPLDVADIDRAILECLPVERVGKTTPIKFPKTPFWEPGKSKSKGDKTPKEPNDLSVIMQRPKEASVATFSSKLPLETILILWKTEKCREALIDEICLVLELTNKGKVNEYKTNTGATGKSVIYSGNHGSLCIKTQQVDNLIDPLLLDDTLTPQLRKENTLNNRISLFNSALPKPENRSGMLIEILEPDEYPKNTDPYLATRIGAMQLGYVNQRIHGLFGNNKKSEKQDESRVKSAVSGLLQQCGILPAPLINSKDGIPQETWLTCLYILRRTRKTTASGNKNIAVLMVRVNPIIGEVEFTTPNLWQKNQKWVSSWEIYKILLTEKWDPTSYIQELPENLILEVEKEQQSLINNFVSEALKNCLYTKIGNNSEPHVLFMVEAQNSRSMLKWLTNPNLPSGKLPQQLKRNLPRQADHKRLSIVRIRTSKNQEVPVWSVENKPGSRTSGVFSWENICDENNQSIYLSLRQLLNTEQGVIKVKESRLDAGKKPAGNPPLLEIAIVYSVFEHDTLAAYLHHLRNRWAYFSGTTALPFPFIFAEKAKEYAVSINDSVEDNS
ncbi:MAG: DUF3962 domain-containing protein [Trichodesmium sp.]